MSPFKSKSQAKAMYAKANAGQIKQSVVDEFAKATPSIKALPEKVKPSGGLKAALEKR